MPGSIHKISRADTAHVAAAWHGAAGAGVVARERGIKRARVVGGAVVGHTVGHALGGAGGVQHVSGGGARGHAANHLKRAVGARSLETLDTSYG